MNQINQASSPVIATGLFGNYVPIMADSTTIKQEIVDDDTNAEQPMDDDISPDYSSDNSGDEYQYQFQWHQVAEPDATVDDHDHEQMDTDVDCAHDESTTDSESSPKKTVYRIRVKLIEHLKCMDVHNEMAMPQIPTDEEKLR